VHDDPPTLPGFYSVDPEATQGPGLPAGPAWTAPTWPAAPDHRPPPPPRNTHATLLGVSLGANVAFIVLLGFLLLGRTSLFASPNTSNGSALSGTTPSIGLSTATPSPTATPQPPAGWLQIAPSQVQLACESGQQTQYVTLSNTGSATVRWQAQIASQLGQPGIAVSPQEGRLRAGTSIDVLIQVQNSSSGDQGVITFKTDTSGAGSPPSLSYTTAACGGAGG
jgi:Viral BACON domain